MANIGPGYFFCGITLEVQSLHERNRRLRFAISDNEHRIADLLHLRGEAAPGVLAANDIDQRSQPQREEGTRHVSYFFRGPPSKSLSTFVSLPCFTLFCLFFLI
jgi:hypothetical protein